MRHCFADFVVDTDTLELTRGGAVVAVEPQVFALITFLIENRHRVVSKTDLIDAVWEGRFVSDSAVSTRIKSARRALDDDGQSQAVIRTVHGKGFRFVAELTEAASDLAPKGADETASTVPQPLASSSVINSWVEAVRRLPGPATAGVVGALLIGVIIVLASRLSAIETPGIRIAVLPIENATGDAAYEWTELGLMSLAAHTLEAQSGQSIVSPRAITSYAPDDAVNADGELTAAPDVIDMLRRAHGASHILLARLRRDESVLALEYRLINTRGVTPLHTAVGADPTALVATMGREVLSMLPRSGERAEPSELISADPFVLEAYARGSALQLEGRAEESRNLFQVAAEQEPNNIRLRVEYAVSTRMMGELDDAAAQYSALAEEARGLGDQETLAAILNGLGLVHRMKRDSVRAIEAYLQALEIDETLGDHAAMGKVLTNLGVEERRRKNYGQAELYLGRALTEYETAGYEAPPGQLLNSLANLRVQMGDLAAAEAYYQRALTSHQVTGETRAEATVWRNLGDLSDRFGRSEEAARRLLRSLQLRREINDVRGQMSSLVMLASVRHAQGRLDETEELVGDLKRLAVESGDKVRLAHAHSLSGLVAAARRNPKRAQAEHEAALALHDKLGRRASIHGERLRILRATRGGDDKAGALALAEEIWRWAQAEKNIALERDAAEARADLALWANDAHDGALWMERALDMARKSTRPSTVGRLAARLGHIRLDLEETGISAGLLGVARENHAEHFETLALAARHAAVDARHDEAVALLARAETAAGEHWTAEYAQCCTPQNTATTRMRAE